MKIKWMLLLLIVGLSVSAGCGDKDETGKAEPEQGLPSLYVTGNRGDKVTNHKEGLVLAGGGTDVDDAMMWMLKQADGGDVVVIRASGADGYNDYFFSKLGVWVNSVRSIVIDSREKAEKDSVYRMVCRAEVLFIAGGDQQNYIRYWKGTKLHKAIRYLIEEKKATVGGTSAGMAVLGGICYAAGEQSAVSSDVLRNPYHADVTLEYDFIHHPWMDNVVTDTHFSQRDRMGRWVTFMARMVTDKDLAAKGIACDEKTAVCIGADRKAVVFGGRAFFACMEEKPDVCVAGKPLEWNGTVCYELTGAADGEHTFDLTGWKEGQGGQWKQMVVKEGKLSLETVK